ncbi:MAG: imidazole glycerol phosphate synthase subunit HisH [Alphaproteobacteria bacterium]|nr:imidazole glycerol phosphate synthase subunit HisH [Alphaproteobacteria bacterium]
MTGAVTVVDYGIGNLLSVQRAFEHCDATVTVTSDPSIIARADRLVVPGVGAFGGCVGELRDRNLIDSILEFTAKGRPFLGICVGMQMMLDISEEFGEHAGLGLIKGRVSAIPTTDSAGAPHKIPFIGWAGLERPGTAEWSQTILADTRPGEAVYFVHSFAAHPVSQSARLADYFYDGAPIVAAIQSGTHFGCQFHPEKSGEVGLKIVRRFSTQ